MHISEKVKKELLSFLKDNRKADLILTYLYFVEKEFKLKPVAFIREKKIYQNLDELLNKLEKEGKLYRETEIKIQFGQQYVNEDTKKKINKIDFIEKTFYKNYDVLKEYVKEKNISIIE